MSAFELVVTEGQHVDRTLATASWYDVHQLTPGTYPIEFRDGNFRAVAEGARPYWAMVKVPSTLVETYRVNRLFTASSSETTHPMTEAVVHVQAYHYQIKDGECLLGHWHGSYGDADYGFVRLGVVREVA